jgi:multicomponent Na+:H+ antiporter subunit F
MSDLLTLATTFLAIVLALGLIAVLRGPGSAERMLAVQLLGTHGVGLLLLLSFALDLSALRDVALVLALLAAVALIAFTRRAGDRDHA